MDHRPANHASVLGTCYSALLRHPRLFAPASNLLFEQDDLAGSSGDRNAPVQFRDAFQQKYLSQHVALAGCLIVQRACATACCFTLPLGIPSRHFTSAEAALLRKNRGQYHMKSPTGDRDRPLLESWNNVIDRSASQTRPLRKAAGKGRWERPLGDL